MDDQYSNTLAALVTLTTAPDISSAFYAGLGFGLTVLVGSLAISMMRTVADDGHEEL